jgi:phosphoribosylformimino-5-aminoimidazole carboxamide ribotide isomerase
MVSAMELIPVLDVMQGRVVRAVRGDRRAYQPIVSSLCPGSDPVTVAQTLCRHTAASVLYVADLDALQGGAVQVGVLRDVVAALPGVRLWLDAGFADVRAVRRLMAPLGPDVAARIDPVYASESLQDVQALAEVVDPADAPGRRAILSLDRRGGQRLDPAGCWERPGLWPARVIVMTLERVGAGTGPDLDTLAEVQRRSPSTRFIGAGGVRDAGDLSAARQAGATAWLVASALHDGRLPPVKAQGSGGR